MVTIVNYNISNITDGSGNVLVNMIRFTSEQTNYTPGFILFLSFYIILFLALKVKGATTSASFAATNFAMFIVAVLMYPLGMIHGLVLVLSIVLLPISIFILYISSSY
jgi:hypothetical protein